MTVAIARRRGVSWPKTRKRVVAPRFSQSEAKYQEAIVDLARGLGWEDYHTHDSRKSRPGFPDLMLLRPPRQVVAELKSRKGVVTPAQQRWLNLFWLCGAETYLWRVGENDISEIADILTARTTPVDIRPLGVQKSGVRNNLNRGTPPELLPMRVAPEFFIRF